MKKVILLLIFIVSFSVANEPLKQISSIYEIPENKLTFLMFSMNHCPWCKKQEKGINTSVKDTYENISFMKVLKGTTLFNELMLSSEHFTVRFFPTSYIVIRNGENFEVLYEMMGYQKNQDIKDILNDKEIMGNY